MIRPITPGDSVHLDRIVLFNFKSFHGQIVVPLASPACTGRGHLTCVVGPNGSGKSTIADALVFCFGERDFRAKGLSALVNEEARAELFGHDNSGRENEEMIVNAEESSRPVKLQAAVEKGRQVAAAVAVDLRVTSSGGTSSILRVTRAILSDPTSRIVSSEYRVDSIECNTGAPSLKAKSGGHSSGATTSQDDEGTVDVFPRDSDAATSSLQHLKIPHGACVSRSALADRLLLLGINLKVVDSFVCTQQGSSFTMLAETELLAVIEALVGTAPLAKEIDALQANCDQALDTAVRLELDEARVRDLRRALAPARASFEAYQATQASFFADLRTFAAQERMLYVYQRAENDESAFRAAAALEAAKEAAQPVEDGLAAAVAAEKAAEKVFSKSRASAKVKANIVAEAEEELGKAQAEARAAARKFTASMKRQSVIHADLNASQKTRADALAASAAASLHIQESDAAMSLAETAYAALFASQTGSLNAQGPDAKTINALQKRSAKLRDARASLADAEILVEAATRAKNGAVATAQAADSLTAAAKSAYTATQSCTSAAAAKAKMAKASLAAFDKASSRAASELADTEARVQRLRRSLNELKASRKASGRPGSIRKAVAPLIANLASAATTEPAGSGRGGAVVIHGWLDELAYYRDRFGPCVNAVLGGALGSVLVVGSRSDAVALVEAAKASGVGPISCDILDELTKSSSAQRDRGLTSGHRKLMDGVDLVDERFRPVFENRLHNWVVCDDDASALAATTPGKGVGTQNAVTWAGNLFMSDGELRISAPTPRHAASAARPGDLRLRDQGSSASEAPRVSSTERDAPDDVESVEVDLRTTEAALVQAAAAARDSDSARSAALQAMRELDASANDMASRALGAAEAFRKAQRGATAARTKAAAAEVSLRCAEVAEAEARADVKGAETALSAVLAGPDAVIGTTDGTWIAAEGKASAAATEARSAAAAARAGERIAASALKAAERMLLRAEGKAAEFEACMTEQEAAKMAAENKNAAAAAELEAKQVLLAAASTALLKPKQEHEAATAAALAAQAGVSEARARVEAALSCVKLAAKQAAALDAWNETMSARDAQLADEAPPPEATQQKKVDHDDLSDIEDKNELHGDLSDSEASVSDDMGAAKMMPANKPRGIQDAEDMVDRDSSDDDEDEVPLMLASRMRKKQKKGSVAKRVSPKTTTKVKRGHSTAKPAPRAAGAASEKKLAVDMVMLKENLAVARAGLRLRREALQKAEDRVDVAALEKDLALAAEEKALSQDADTQRRRATNALERKGRIELERFTKLFGSLEQLGCAFSEAYGNLTHEGEADLRFSRDPQSLYKEGVSMYAKPARSVWRLAKSLSGGQQATVGLALLFAFQTLFRSPFYLLDEVDASLDSQHAARAGRLMQRRAAAEGVQYVAISHRPQLFLHADRVVGTFGLPGAASGCVALDFPRLDCSSAAASTP